MLSNTQLLDFNLGSPRGVDKRFRINLTNEKYIDGALIFNDCSYQSCGNNLSSPMGINTAGCTDDNAYDFHVLFSFENIQSATFNFTGSSSESLMIKSKVKYGYIDGDFYNTLVNNATGENGNYGKNINGDFYFASGEEVTAITDKGASGSVQYSTNSSANVVALQFTYHMGKDYIFDNKNDYISPNQHLQFCLSQISFTYTCN